MSELNKNQPASSAAQNVSESKKNQPASSAAQNGSESKKNQPASSAAQNVSESNKNQPASSAAQNVSESNKNQPASSAAQNVSESKKNQPASSAAQNVSEYITDPTISSAGQNVSEYIKCPPVSSAVSNVSTCPHTQPISTIASNGSKCMNCLAESNACRCQIMNNVNSAASNVSGCQKCSAVPSAASAVYRNPNMPDSSYVSKSPKPPFSLGAASNVNYPSMNAPKGTYLPGNVKVTGHVKGFEPRFVPQNAYPSSLTEEGSKDDFDSSSSCSTMSDHFPIRLKLNMKTGNLEGGQLTAEVGKIPQLNMQTVSAKNQGPRPQRLQPNGSGIKEDYQFITPLSPTGSGLEYFSCASDTSDEETVDIPCEETMDPSRQQTQDPSRQQTQDPSRQQTQGSCHPSTETSDPFSNRMGVGKQSKADRDSAILKLLNQAILLMRENFQGSTTSSKKTSSSITRRSQDSSVKTTPPPKIECKPPEQIMRDFRTPCNALRSILDDLKNSCGPCKELQSILYTTTTTTSSKCSEDTKLNSRCSKLMAKYMNNDPSIGCTCQDTSTRSSADSTGTECDCTDESTEQQDGQSVTTPSPPALTQPTELTQPPGLPPAPGLSPAAGLIPTCPCYNYFMAFIASNQGKGLIFPGIGAVGQIPFPILPEATDASEGQGNGCYCAEEDIIEEEYGKRSTRENMSSQRASGASERCKMEEEYTSPEMALEYMERLGSMLTGDKNSPEAFGRLYEGEDDMDYLLDGMNEEYGQDSECLKEKRAESLKTKENGVCTCCHCRDMKNHRQSGVGMTDDVREFKSFIDSLIMDLDAMEHARRKCDLIANICLSKPKSCCRESFPVTILDVQDLGTTSLYVKWTIHDCYGIGGYEIYVDGYLTNRYYHSRHDAAVITDVDVTIPHKITLLATPLRDEGMRMICCPESKPKCGMQECIPKPSSLWTPSIYLYDPDTCNKSPPVSTFLGN